MSRSATRKPQAFALVERDCKNLARSFDIQRFRLTTDGRLLFIDGDVPCYRTKRLAAAAAQRLLEGQRIVNRLRVVPQSRHSEGELAQAVHAVFAANPVLRDEVITVSVSDGVVTLRGAVPSLAVRREAEAAAWTVGGVVDVEDRLRPKPAAPRRTA